MKKGNKKRAKSAKKTIGKRGRPSKPRKPRFAKIKVQLPKGVHDILPQDQVYWDKIRTVLNQIAKNYGFNRIDVPIFEDIRLYEKGTGATTDIVQKEIYTLKTRGEEVLALRPEFTPGIVRAYIEHGMKNLPHPVKLYTIGPLFRHDKPQAGRYRQFHQMDFEIIGDPTGVSDAQVIKACLVILKRLGLKKINLCVNSIGCPICVPGYKKALIGHYRKDIDKLCVDCKRRFKENPLRLLDCKKNKCKKIAEKAPHVIDFLCEECHNHFKEVLEFLDEMDIAYNLDPYLVRGLDYYTKTVFEIFEESDKNALVGGGRYDNMVEMFKGKPTPAVGVALGIERIIDSLKKQDIKISKDDKPRIFIIQLGDLGKKKALKLFEDFQKKGIKTAESFSKPSITSQLKIADKMGVEMVLILGQKEALDNTIIIRDMHSGVQETIPLDKIINEVKKRLKK